MNQREAAIFQGYISGKGLKRSQQRTDIMSAFLKTEKHVSADELYMIVKKVNPAIGSATVYRTLKLLCECGLCRELQFEDGTSRYEHNYGHKHHDHLICTKCGKFVEIMDESIESLQDRMFKRHGFSPQRHRLELYGVCRACK